MKVRTIIEQTGATTAGIPVPDEVLTALGAGKRPPITVALNGYTYRSSVASMGGRSLIPLSSAHRAAAGVAGGDLVDIEIELDRAPREVVVPGDLAAALAAEPAAGSSRG